MKMVKIVESYILLTTVFVIIFISIIMIFLMIIKKVFNMNSMKWDLLFKYKNSIVLYCIVLLAYFFSAIILVPITNAWFSIIGVNSSKFISILVSVILLIVGVFKAPGIKKKLNKLLIFKGEKE